MDPSVIVALVSAVAAVITAVIAQWAQLRATQHRSAVVPRSEAGTDYDAAVGAARRAVHAFQELEHELRKRGEEVERLRSEQTLLEMSQKEVAAVQELVTRDSKRSFWLGVVVNFLFFAAGVGVSLLIG